MKFSIKKLVAGTGVFLMLSGSVIPTVLASAENEQNVENNGEIPKATMVDSVKEVLEPNYEEVMETNNVVPANMSQNEMSNAEAQSLEQELRDFAQNLSTWSAILGLIPEPLTSIFAAGTVFSQAQARSMANEIAEKNIGYGVVFVTNTNTGNFSIQSNTAGPRPWNEILNIN